MITFQICNLEDNITVITQSMSGLFILSSYKNVDLKTALDLK